MSTPDVFMSSPPRSRKLDSILLSSSSPCLPSLEELLFNKKPQKPALRTGSDAAPIGANTRTAPTTAATILRQAPEIDIETEKITISPSRRNNPNKSRKRKSTTPEDSSIEQVSEQANRATKSISPHTKPWQKFKSHNSHNLGGESVSPSRPRVSSLGNLPRNRAETVSRHFSTEARGLPLEASEGKDKGASLTAAFPLTNIEPVIHRRHDWTPPRASAVVVIDSDSDNRELFSSGDRKAGSKDVFETLYDQYGRQDAGLLSEMPPPLRTEVLRKRQRLEPFSIGQERPIDPAPGQASATNSRDKKLEENKPIEKKVPAQRKKARTVTEAAIAPFTEPAVPDLELAEPSSKDSLLEYFDADGAVKALVEHQTAVMSQRKGKGKVAKLPTKTDPKKKTTSAKNPILLSPSSALKQSSHQDFVFGTSSQLVQEDSPTTLRDLQAAIRASNSLSSDPFNEDDNDDMSCRHLWRAGARDEDGELLKMDIVDLQGNTLPPMGHTRTPKPEARSFVDIDDLLDSPVPKANPTDGPSEPQPNNSHFFMSQTMKGSTDAATSGTAGVVDKANVQPCPNYELFTDAQLSSQITSYGFKPMKRRNAMITLLKQCWASKHSGVSQGSAMPMSTSCASPAAPQLADSVMVPAAAKPRGRGRPKKTDNSKTSATQPIVSTEASPKRARGRPKKSETASVVPAPVTNAASTAPNPKKPRGRPRKPSSASVEIPDSEKETPSPVSSPDRVFSSPPPIDLSTTDEGDLSLTLSPTDQQAELFKHITTAVTSEPRSQDPSNPSWHEKMLLYDPVILEDLATWLNGGPLTGAGYDGEVTPADVKKWCERKSVICLWRQNIKGKERKRY
ncbi:hypothetical protein GGS20DRAFT_535867 [Poronia punctata]|nr:hypothetical protein GGS20DRAFT_535867 [Poronia punctata]